MALEFDTPPVSRRERREREAQLLERGATAEQAAVAAAGNSGSIDLGPSVPTVNTPRRSAPEPPSHYATTPTATDPSFSSLAAPTFQREPSIDSTNRRQLSRRELRNRTTEQVNRLSNTGAQPTGYELAAGGAAPTAAGPERLIEPRAPFESILEGAPLHWSQGLSLPINVDPTDPASVAEVPALVSDTSTTGLGEIPTLQALVRHTGPLDLAVTNSILLPTELTETGALSRLVDSGDGEDDLMNDEVALSSHAPKAARTAVSSNTRTPTLVADAPKARLSAGTIIAIIAGGIAAVVLIAFGVGALFNLF